VTEGSSFLQKLYCVQWLPTYHHLRQKEGKAHAASTQLSGFLERERGWGTGRRGTQTAVWDIIIIALRLAGIRVLGSGFKKKFRRF